MAAESSNSAHEERNRPEVPAIDSTHATGAVQIRDRIKELRRVAAKELLPNPKNWRRHPKSQAEALRGLLTEVGYADALLVRELSDGRLMIIDGHLRAETTPDAMVPVLVLDVTDEEADKILLTLDPLAAMAESDAERIKALLRMVGTESDAVQDLLSGSPDRNFGEFCIPRTSTRPRSHPTAPRSFRRNGVPNWARSGRLARIASSAATAPTSTSSRA